MANKLASAYDRSLSEMFAAFGLTRFARGVYAKSSDGIIWHGIWITFTVSKGRLVIQPSVCVFCPSAEKIVSDVLEEVYGEPEIPLYFGKLGGPVLTNLLYNLVRDMGVERMPFSYDISTIRQIDESIKLLRNDYERAGIAFLNAIDSLEELRNKLLKNGAASAPMYVIAVTYMINKTITSVQVEEALGQQPNTMSQDFAERFREKFANAFS